MEFITFLSDKNLNFALSLTNLFLLVVFIVEYITYKNKNFLYFLTSYILYGIAYFITYYRDSIPIIFSILIANMILVGSEMIFILGLSNFLDLSIKRNHFTILISIFTLIHSIYIYIIPSISIRVINFSAIYIIILSIFIIKLFKKYKKKWDSTVFILGLCSSIMIPYHIYRLINAAVFEDISHLFRDSSVFKGYLLLSILTTTLKSGAILSYNTKYLLED